MADEICSYQKLKISFAMQPSGELSSSASGGGMPSAVGISGDVAASATVLAGLILVFLGAVAISFDLMRKRNRQPSGADISDMLGSHSSDSCWSFYQHFCASRKMAQSGVCCA